MVHTVPRPRTRLSVDLPSSRTLASAYRTPLLIDSATVLALATVPSRERAQDLEGKYREATRPPYLQLSTVSSFQDRIAPHKRGADPHG